MFGYVAIFVAIVALLFATDSGAVASGPRAVSLADASGAPSFVAMVPASGRATVPARCHPTDVQAYRWHGGSLAAQAYSGRVAFWRPRDSVRRVTYSGQTFRNGLRVSVLVAAWCG